MNDGWRNSAEPLAQSADARYKLKHTGKQYRETKRLHAVLTNDFTTDHRKSCSWPANLQW